MKRNTVVALGIVAIVLVAMALLTALLTALREGDESTLHIHVMSSRTDTNGNETVSFMVTNGNPKAFPWFATTTPNGQAPYYIIETKTQEGWRRTTPFTNYWFTHHLLPNTSWEFETSLAGSDRARRVIFFYTIGQRARPWLVDQMHNFLKNLALEKGEHELRSAILEANQIGAANGSQPVRSGTNSTSSAAGSRR
ncbi:MAG TPA: hypothetical protein VNT26_15105 [Candidatus Sulfotelmatobacter sp.]|nr:hypothetical protein [Candidatus Sulfotelmatobacter sp.]